MEDKELGEYGQGNRYIKVLEIINELNRQHRQGENEIFDCGELGFVHLWWHASWQWKWKWIKPSTEFKGEGK